MAAHIKDRHLIPQEDLRDVRGSGFAVLVLKGPHLFDTPILTHILLKAHNNSRRLLTHISISVFFLL